MRCRDLAATVALLLLPAAALALAQATDDDGADGGIACDAFQRQPLGAWTVLRETTIAPNGVTVDLPAGQTFAAGETYEDIDIGAILDRTCGGRR